MTSSTNEIENQRPAATSPPQVSDAALVDRATGGDEAALRALMDRYDRLVRYTIFRLGRDRCRQDPAWLDTVAADTWVGFLRSAQRSAETPASAAAYLLRVARNQAVSALRSAKRADAHAARMPDVDLEIEVDLVEVLGAVEELDALRDCLSTLTGDDRLLATQLSAISERRWRDASEVLGWAESTVRSRWKRTLKALRACMVGKTGKNFAPDGAGDDV